MKGKTKVRRQFGKLLKIPKQGQNAEDKSCLKTNVYSHEEGGYCEESQRIQHTIIRANSRLKSEMVFHFNASCCLSSASALFDVFTPSSFSIRMLVFLAMFLMHGNNTAVEGKSFSTRIHRNVTILCRTGKYLTVDHHGVIGKDFYSPNGNTSKDFM